MKSKKNLRCKHLLIVATFATSIQATTYRSIYGAEKNVETTTSLADQTSKAGTNEGSDNSTFDLVVNNEADQPRFTPITRHAMKQYIEDLKRRTPRIPLPVLNEEEQKRANEDNRQFGYEARLRSTYLPEGNSTGGYNGFGGMSPRGNVSSNAPRGMNTPLDPKLTLDYAFKVRLFWIAARGNNCQYCLGHQESKLLAAGMTEDQIAALDSDWSQFPDAERAAFSLARRLTIEPHMISDADIEACRPFYNDLQILEMIGSIAGNNAINRWKEGTGVPQSDNGGNFGRDRGDANRQSASTVGSDHKNESHSYLTPTSDRFHSRETLVAIHNLDDVTLKQISATRCNRPQLERGAELASKLALVQERKPRLPLASKEDTAAAFEEFADSNAPTWQRLLANFPTAGKRFVVGLANAKNADQLSPLLQTKIDWVIARQDRAWYAASLAHEQMTAGGVTAAEIAALDGDLRSDDPSLDSRERALLLVARNLAASPIVLTDKQVADAVTAAGPRAVTQAINYTTYRAAFDRITEAAGLSK